MSSPTQQQPTPQMLMEHQMRLNQLQQLYQLQTQIFQQQIELLSGQTPFMPLVMDRTREQQQYLPTPAASTEIPPQPSPGFVPPMLLQNSEPNVNSSQNAHQNSDQQYMQHHMIPSAPHSAPANLVFQNIHSSPYPIPPADMDFDEMSPLTSPWLGAYNTGQASDMPESSRGMQQQQQHPSSSGTTAQKRRTASPTSDDRGAPGRPSRKRQTPASRLTIPPNTVAPSIPSMNRTRRGSLRGGTKSASSTPLFPPLGPAAAAGAMTPPSNRLIRSGPSRGAATTPIEAPGDTPSPVDLSMPPPATPLPQAPLHFVPQGNVGSAEHTPAPTPTPVPPPHAQGQGQMQIHGLITPVTPASIMNLGRLGTDSSLTPPIAVDANAPQAANKTKTRGSARPRSATAGNTSKAALVSPALKPIRPAGGGSGRGDGGSSSAASTSSPPGGGDGGDGGQPPLQVRKTSHKAAEQKRRDSLKTSFDDLRLLLPPIPLPSDEGYADEPVLPGAMPPRGPPKGSADGPNRGVSKLQLLRCGNDYIRRLAGRVERRDDEIACLRGEVRRLRLVTGGEAVSEEGLEPVDLERDLDAIEATLVPLGRSAAFAEDDEDGGD
ncbi:uncharacterized protein PHACADRAFT_251234 [Phanerochaete carnosa HHB-10118-sp]|uniref:BHLH domain-containing protein n=1 Tax=Phanerochaete carnosa (strain HHB-10118-sp) TaxID=650164 RepID=K5WE24_PHACS|nr:uncharacterized protein PHACADRAFT_251234 [Phanerochaete carnosa HHB-10118-sp]EKM57545.1 hypothetical protein PHACADRAFT_251234 [Phanerochaete carnosa HHB-10118-sp]